MEIDFSTILKTCPTCNSTARFKNEKYSPSYPLDMVKGAVNQMMLTGQMISCLKYLEANGLNEKGKSLLSEVINRFDNIPKFNELQNTGKASNSGESKEIQGSKTIPTPGHR